MIPAFALATWGWISPDDANDSPPGSGEQAPEVEAHPSSTLACLECEQAERLVNALGAIR